MSVSPKLNTCLSPSLIPHFNLEKTVVVIIDIFRATSTICAALDNGAKAVMPVATVAECLELEAFHPEYITAGERNGHVIKGLRGGNSPSEYTPEIIADKVLALTTTNGTRLLHLVKAAKEIVAGSFLNIDALCRYLIESDKDVLLACAGWHDKVNLEDTVFAGAVIQRISSHFELNCDSSVMALNLYKEALGFPSLFDFLKTGTHYNRLAKFHLEKDMMYCCSCNLHPVVPLFKDPFLIAESALVSVGASDLFHEN